MITCLSLGMGVQTTALYYMASMGLCERADVAVFADTGAEHPGTYAHLKLLLDWQKRNDGIPVSVVAERNIYQDYVNQNGKRLAKIPAFADQGHKRMLRQCTAEYKIEQVVMGLRRFYDLEPGRWLPKTRLQLGITVDEIFRARDSRNPRLVNEYPLIDMGWRRSNCTAWLKDNGFDVPPKSACVFCPYQSDYAWRKIRSVPEEFKMAIAVDEAIRDMSDRGLREKFYLHRSCKPIEEVRFRPDLFDRFQEECDGVCGT